MTQPTLLLLANSSYYLYNFRLGLLNNLRSAGYRVIIAAPKDEFTAPLTALDFQWHQVHRLSRRGMNPLQDLAFCREIYQLCRSVKPDLVLNFSIKPNIYGSIGARLAGSHSISTITGLGYSCNHGGLLRGLVLSLYRLSSFCNSQVVFQNRDDLDLFCAKNIVTPEKASLSPGSGVDLTRFALSELPTPTRFLFVGRLLRDKGVLEFVQAARLVRAQRPDAEFCLLGPLDPDNPSAITKSELEQIQHNGITYLGSADDVRPFLANASVLVLPALGGEGVPKSLLEGMAMGRAIITTDTPGCRDTVAEGVNGYLCARSPEPIAEAALNFLALTTAQQRDMSLKSRALAEEKFDEQLVLQLYRSVCDRLTGRKEAGTCC